MPLLNPGDEVLIPTPNYSLWSNTILLAGAKPVYYRCDEASGWNPDVQDLRRKVTSRTRAMVIINPNNPTGVLYDTQVLRDMLQVAREHDLIVFSDEIYDRLVMDGLEHVSSASLAPDLTVVTMNGLSKSHSLCGYRCGWMAISGPRANTEDYRRGIVQLTSMRLCSNALAQLVIPAALEDMETPRSMVCPDGRYFKQRAATLEVLDTIDGISYVKNVAAFYLFPRLDAKKFGINDDRKFAADLGRRAQHAELRALKAGDAAGGRAASRSHDPPRQFSGRLPSELTSDISKAANEKPVCGSFLHQVCVAQEIQNHKYGGIDCTLNGELFPLHCVLPFLEGSAQKGQCANQRAGLNDHHRILQHGHKLHDSVFLTLPARSPA